MVLGLTDVTRGGLSAYPARKIVVCRLEPSSVTFTSYTPAEAAAGTQLSSLSDSHTTEEHTAVPMRIEAPGSDMPKWWPWTVTTFPPNAGPNIGTTARMRGSCTR